MSKSAEALTPARDPARRKSRLQPRIKSPRPEKKGEMQKLQQKAGNRAVDSLLPPAEQSAELIARSLAGNSQGGLGAGAQPVPSEKVEMKGSGTPLLAAIKQVFRPVAGRSLDDARIHNDDQTAITARELGALAFTQDNHIGFAEGQFNPASPAGRRLLAHEIGHIGQPGLHLAPDKEKKKAPTPLEQAESSLDKGFKKIDNGKAADITAGVGLVRQGITQLKQAAAAETDVDKKARMQRVAQVLETLAVTILASQKGGAGAVRKAFESKKESVLGGKEISEGKVAEAASLYKNVAQDFTDLFPNIAFESGIVVAMFSSEVESRLDVMKAMAAGGAAPKHYPPTRDEVEQYFTNLGTAGVKNEEVTKAYTDFAEAFFEHVSTPFNPGSMDAGPVYQGRQTLFGKTHTDCDGFVRLGVSLLTKAGFKLEPRGIHVGIRNHKTTIKDTEIYDDAHAIAVLTRKGETVFLSNKETFGSEDAAFNVAWDYPDAKLYIGSGNNVKEAQEDALKKILQQ